MNEDDFKKYQKNCEYALYCMKGINKHRRRVHRSILIRGVFRRIRGIMLLLLLTTVVVLILLGVSLLGFDMSTPLVLPKDDSPSMSLAGAMSGTIG